MRSNNTSAFLRPLPIATLPVLMALVVPAFGPAGTRPLRAPYPAARVASTPSLTPAGKLSVVAGTVKPGLPTPGPAIKSALNAPSGVALDSHGDLFIADSNNNVVE